MQYQATPATGQLKKPIRDSWDKVTSSGSAGYNLYLMILSNKSTAGPKPRFFLMAEVHAREYVTAETALRFAEHLLSGYGIDPDITWLLDYYEVHVLPMTNPDGRKQAETGILWRKNTDSDDGCSYSSYWGTDLNRNYALVHRLRLNQKFRQFRIMLLTFSPTNEAQGIPIPRQRIQLVFLLRSTVMANSCSGRGVGQRRRRQMPVSFKPLGGNWPI